MTGLDKFKLKTLKSLPFVKWDRYTANSYYGWIDREDSYKDFVVISFYGINDIGYITSSVKYDEKVGTLLGIADDERHPCKRIEHQFKLKNCIKLNNHPTATTGLWDSKESDLI